jgi:hypothetical protein
MTDDNRGPYFLTSEGEKSDQNLFDLDSPEEVKFDKYINLKAAYDAITEELQRRALETQLGENPTN